MLKNTYLFAKKLQEISEDNHVFEYPFVREGTVGMSRPHGVPRAQRYSVHQTQKSVPFGKLFRNQ